MNKYWLENEMQNMNIWTKAPGRSSTYGFPSELYKTFAARFTESVWCIKKEPIFRIEKTDTRYKNLRERWMRKLERLLLEKEAKDRVCMSSISNPSRCPIRESKSSCSSSCSQSCRFENRVEEALNPKGANVLPNYHSNTNQQSVHGPEGPKEATNYPTSLN